MPESISNLHEIRAVRERIGDDPPPGRLYRHRVLFNFVITFRSLRVTTSEMARFARLLRAEVTASRTLEKLSYES